MKPDADLPRTNHPLWAAGFLMLLLPLPMLVWMVEGGPPRKKPVPGGNRPTPEAVLFPVKWGSGGVTCGQCNGDGKIDPTDKRRSVPSSLASQGDCPYCE